MKTLSLFSGIGGIELALAQIGVEPVAFCDNESFCQKILRKHWGNVPVFDDVCQLDIARLMASGVPVAGINMITGGYPCQSHSVAGKRLGRDDERYLWPEMSRLIAEIKPEYVIGENVEGLLSSSDGAVFGEILSDMSNMGYKVGWCCYPASDVGCVHPRKRVFSFGIKDNSGWMPDKTLVQDALVGWLTYSMWPALPGQKQKTYEPSRVVFVDADKDRSKRIKAIGNAVSPMQIFPIVLAVLCRGDISYLDFTDVNMQWRRICSEVYMFEHKLAVIEECFGLVNNVFSQSSSKTFAHLREASWYVGDRPFIGKTISKITNWPKWGYVCGNQCMTYKPDYDKSTLYRQLVLDTSCNHRVYKNESALWATPQSNTTAGELPEHLVNNKGNTVQPGEKMYRRDTGRMVQTALTTQVKMWPGEHVDFSYQPVSVFWPRPSNTDVSQVLNYIYPTYNEFESLSQCAKSSSGKRAMLNPDWEEMLMGLPIGWTKLNL